LLIGCGFIGGGLKGIIALHEPTYQVTKN
jgi:hypothetical protein